MKGLAGVAKDVVDVFGRMRFFNSYINLATGKKRGAALVSLEHSKALDMLEKMNQTKNGKLLSKHVSYVDVDEPELTEIIESATDSDTLRCAINTVRPEAGEYLVICNIYTASDNNAAATTWAVIRESIC